MNFNLQSRKKLVAWLAMFVMLMQAMMPTLSHAGVGTFAKNLAEICTASGVKSVVVDGSVPAKDNHDDHCPYCFCAGDAALPSAGDADNPALEFIGTTASAVIATNSKTSFSLAADPRGPPARRA